MYDDTTPSGSPHQPLPSPGATTSHPSHPLLGSAGGASVGGAQQGQSLVGTYSLHQQHQGSPQRQEAHAAAAQQGGGLLPMQVCAAASLARRLASSSRLRLPTAHHLQLGSSARSMRCSCAVTSSSAYLPTRHCAPASLPTLYPPLPIPRPCRRAAGLA